MWPWWHLRGTEVPCLSNGDAKVGDFQILNFLRRKTLSSLLHSSCQKQTCRFAFKGEREIKIDLKRSAAAWCLGVCVEPEHWPAITWAGWMVKVKDWTPSADFEKYALKVKMISQTGNKHMLGCQGNVHSLTCRLWIFKTPTVSPSRHPSWVLSFIYHAKPFFLLLTRAVLDAGKARATETLIQNTAWGAKDIVSTGLVTLKAK